MNQFNYSHKEVESDFLAVKSFLEQKNSQALARLIDSTTLKIQTKSENVVNLCKEAKQFDFRAVCIPPCHVTLAAQELNHSGSAVCTVIGFPNGYQTTETKCFEMQQAIKMGAQEIDFVQNISFVKENNFTALANEFLSLVKLCERRVLKVILETSILSAQEIYHCTLLAAQSGIHIIKTSTGFGERGASLQDIEIIKTALDEHFKKSNIRLGIKASGGIRQKEDAILFINAGATRLGTSNGKNIVGN